MFIIDTVQFTSRCITTTCPEQVTGTPKRCDDCEHLVRIGANVDRLSPRGLRYMKATLHGDPDLDRVM